ncbi:ribosome biogenesis regulatory protein [Heterostelium album PN500]|uniref:Ribosome biogenesis regulatory protein n=1 Tax=Heterostelium pallidum (strain ATCC 26659 / Pp 5 / PN500) TaxID=670386 RepID=D3BEK8_HETP5|nr:ribosome biogenesis regulatory protein [Heterostelium album PN500]EFA80339.1 ribosome biogenesis regulatory protein [Heterostelium album PN500]|eukprot:XP_020432459.1 ribosome biogenesis regulatory protein [Heterostelium album PN500]
MSTSTTSTGVVNASDILENSRYSSGHLVDKDDTLKYDLKNLTAYDYSSINKVEFKENEEEYLKNLSRDNVQLLVTKLFSLPIKAIEEGALALLPNDFASLTPTPREKELPSAKSHTRWEAFAALKGIKKKGKKARMEWDEHYQEYRQSYGANRANKHEDYIMEAKESDKVGEDPFSKAEEEKREKVNKQKKRENRNLEESSMRSNAGIGKVKDFGKDNRSQLKSDIGNTFNVAKVSTASMGKFDRLMKDEAVKPQRNVKKQRGLGDDSNIANENKSNMKVLDRIFNKESNINVDKATNQFIAQEQKANYNKKFDRPQKRQKK